MAGMLWVKLYQGHKIKRDLTVPCGRADPTEALREALHTLDLSMPVWLPRHWDDWRKHAMTRFLPEHFMEGVPFEYMELSYFDPDDKKVERRSFDDDD